jgi:hypothetical protein
MTEITSFSELSRVFEGDDVVARQDLVRVSLDHSVVEVVASCDNEWLRLLVVANKNLGPDGLSLFVGDPSTRVREELANRRAAGPTILAILSKDPVAVVRLTVARNKKCPKEVLAFLAHDPIDYVRDAAGQGLARIEKER